MANESCAFCCRPLDQTMLLIAGYADNIFICDECVERFSHVVRQEVEHRKRQGKKGGSPSG